MGLREVFIEAFPGVLDDAGEDASFTPTVGDSIPAIKILIDFDVLLQPSGVDPQTWIKGTVISTALSLFEATPRRGDYFTYDAVDYTIQSIIKNDGIEIQMQVV